MKQERRFPFVIVTKKQEISIRNGHPWVYEDEILEQSGPIENGSFADVLSGKGVYLGTGFWSMQSKIRIRILSNNANETFSDAFFERRVRYAVQYRKNVMPGQLSCCRMIHGEADGLPGMTVDCYNDILVAEVLSYGMDLHKKTVYQALVKNLAEAGQTISGIYERNEGELRKKEGLSQYKGWYAMDGLSTSCGSLTQIEENGILYEVDVENGQKTGFFLDQKYNRLAVRSIAQGKNVLDCCTHTGSFALNALKGNALHVSAVDVSQYALETAKKNAALNHMEDRIDFIQADMMDLLPRYLQEHRHFDLVILDPPAFTKSRKTFSHAESGYEKINTMAMRLLERGGYLATASCSHFMPTEAFRRMLHKSALAAGREVRIVEERHASMDHPVMLSIPETEYLKFFICQIL